MAPDCQAGQRVPADFGTDGQLACDLPVGHQGILHFDRDLRVWWMPAVPGERPEDIPPMLRMNEDIPAMLQGEWGAAR
jgi:hypothetical protein